MIIASSRPGERGRDQQAGDQLNTGMRISVTPGARIRSSVHSVVEACRIIPQPA